MVMKGIVKDKTIILAEPLPEGLQDGDEIEVVIVSVRKGKEAYPFPVFDLGIKGEYLEREHIYEPDPPLS